MSQRLVGGFIPPPAPLVGDPSGAVRDPRDRDLDLWNRLQLEPIIPIQIPTVTVSKSIISRPCIFAGWSLRETTTYNPAQVEFINGADATGEIVGEQSLTTPLITALGFADVEVDASSALAAAANNVVLAGVANFTTYITGFEITGFGATGVLILAVTVTGILGGTKTYYMSIPAGAGVAVAPLQVEFSRPIPATSVNTAITVNVPSFGVGNTNAAVTAHGFQRYVPSTTGIVGVTMVASLPSPGVLCRSGLWLRVIAGSVVGAAYIRM